MADNQEDLPVEAFCLMLALTVVAARVWRHTDNPAVVPQVPMQYREANVEEDPVGGLIQQETPKHLQAVGVNIELMEVVKTRVAGYLEFLGVWTRCEKQSET